MSNKPLNLKPILDKYNLHQARVTLETSKEKKAVWWVEKETKKYVLKKMPVSKERLLFLLSASDHLRSRGMNIPEVCRTTDGSPFVEDGHDLYIVMKAITGKTPNYNASRELAKIMEGLAAFHRASNGFNPPAGVSIRRHLGNWQKKYEESIEDLENFRATADEGKNEFERYYLENCDYFITEAKECLAALEKPAYGKWLEKVRQETNLCHQDFAAGNLGLVNGKLYIYDLDSITIDLPARDLRKILNKVMKKRGQWDRDLVKLMVESYQKVNPLTPEEYEVVMTDVRFPHLFYGIASKYFTGREKEWSPDKFLHRLQEMTNVEKSKGEVVAWATNLLI